MTLAGSGEVSITEISYAGKPPGREKSRRLPFFGVDNDRLV